MKLRENLKKEDFYDCYFEPKDKTEAECVIKLLEELGFHGFSSLHRTGNKILVFQNIYSGKDEYEPADAKYLDRWTKKTLAHLTEIEPAKYFKCESVTAFDDPKLEFGRIYKALYVNDFYGMMKLQVGTEEGYYNTYKFKPTTEKEYIEQEGLNFHNEFKKALKTIEDQEKEAYQENKKTFDENIKRTMPEWVIKRTKEELIKQGYQLITEEQIATLADISPTVKAQLREFFPEAKCLQPEKKEPETTYSIGDRFLSSWGGKEYMLSTMGGGVVGLINLEYGTYAGEPLKVENVYCISESEMNELKKLTEFEFTRI